MVIDKSDPIGSSKSTQFEVTLVDEFCKPVCHALRKLSSIKREYVDKELDKMLNTGILSRCFSPWASALVVVPKPGPGDDLRLCVDLRDVNNVCETINYPLPDIDDIV